MDQAESEGQTFFGSSKEAVLTQFWIALCLYLLLSYIIKVKIGWTIHQMFRMLQLNLFERKDLLDIFREEPVRIRSQTACLPLLENL
jgi:hypothetical protein